MRSIHKLAKESNVSYGIMSTVLRKDLKMSPFKHVKKHQLSAQVVDKRLQRCKILLTRIQDARCQTPFSVMRGNSMLNTTLTPKMIEFGRGMEMKDPVWWLGSNVWPQ